MPTKKRLIASDQLPKGLGSLKNPEFFYSACDTVRLLSGLGYSWRDIEKTLISQFKPYDYAHPDLEIIQKSMSIQNGHSIR